MLAHPYLVAEFLSLVRYSDVRTPMAKEEIEEEICHINCFFCWRSTSFWPLGEVVSDYNDVLVALVGTRKGANQVYADLLPSVVWNRYRMQLCRWTIKFSFCSLALVTVLYLYRKMMN